MTDTSQPMVRPTELTPPPSCVGRLTAGSGTPGAGVNGGQSGRSASQLDTFWSA